MLRFYRQYYELRTKIELIIIFFILMHSVPGNVINQPCCYCIWNVIAELNGLRGHFADADTPTVHGHLVERLVLPFGHHTRVRKCFHISPAKRIHNARQRILVAIFHIIIICRPVILIVITW
jgi:hypothetical protein